MKNVLMVAFHYPPDNSSTGVLRTLKFTRYLGEFGWQPHVLTVDPVIYPFRDSGLNAQVPRGVEVTRVWCPDIKRCLGLNSRYPGWLAIPDRYTGWLLTGYRPGYRVLSGKEFSLLYSTQPVPTAHLLAWRFQRATGLPWVADFRDPWVEGSYTGLRGRIEAWLERLVVTTCDRVICTTPRMRDDFLRRYPDLASSRFIVIPNGYDETDFTGLPAPPTNGPLTIIHPGMLDAGNRNPLPLIEAVGMAVRQGGIPLGDVSLCFLGGGSFLFSPSVEKALMDWGLENATIRVRDRVPYEDSLRRLAQADVLAILQAVVGNTPELVAEREFTRMLVPAKLYEYVRLGRPILALVDDGASRDLLQRLGAGCAISPARPEGAAHFLIRCYADRQTLRSKPLAVPEAIARYERRTLTRELVEVFDQITSGRTREFMDACI
jgi:hypothetical protein